MRTGRGFRHLTTLIAVAILLSLIAIGAILFPNFAAPSNLANLLGDYAYVGIAAVGATLVIASGGIDLSVGSLVAFTAVITGWLITHGWHPLAAGAMGLAAGASCGAVMGWLIQAFELPPFIVTLVGMFALRAGCFVVTGQSQGISHPFLDRVAAGYQLSLGGGVTVPFRSGLLLAVVVVGALVSRSTPFGRQVFAIGGSRRSAELMGVPVRGTLISLYGMAGLLSALAGVVFAFYKRAGDPTAASGLELSVIAAVVIGGTLLTGGVGSIFGTLVGLLILGVIRLLIDFQGNLNSAWTSISIGGLLLGFVVLQKVIGLASGHAVAEVSPALPRRVTS